MLLQSLWEGIVYSSSTGRMLAGIFTALAAYGRELMHERTAAAGAVRPGPGHGLPGPAQGHPRPA